MEEDLVLTAPQQRYVEWLCTAPGERVPSTKQELALELGVDPSTLRRWEKRDHFRSQWESRSKAVQGSPERTQGVLDTLHTRALDGDVRAAQLWLQAMNKMAPAQLEVKTERRAAELSDAELEELISVMALHEQSQRKHLKVM